MASYLISTSTAQSGDLTISDTTNSTWGRGASGWLHISALGIYWYWGIFSVVNSYTAGKVTANVSGYNSGVSYTNLTLEEFSGELTSGSFDVGGGVNSSYVYASGQTINGPSLTTTANGDLILLMVVDGYEAVTSFNAGSGLTILQTSYTGGKLFQADEWGTQSVSGSITPTIVITAGAGGSSGLLIFAGAFKPAGGGSANWLTMGYWENGGPYAKHRDMNQRNWRKNNGICIPS
jgi:hypothetical protein